MRFSEVKVLRMMVSFHKDVFHKQFGFDLPQEVPAPSGAGQVEGTSVVVHDLGWAKKEKKGEGRTREGAFMSEYDSELNGFRYLIEYRALDSVDVQRSWVVC
jgi:hypothetical protein